MSDHQRPKSRRARRRSNSFADKIYYYIVGALLIVLIILIGYIYFSSRGSVGGPLSNKVTIEEKAFLSGSNSSSEGDSTDNKNSEQSESVELNENAQIPDGEIDVVVQAQAPIDESYVPDFSEGSADMDAVERGVAGIVGADPTDLNAIWIGNDGPGRIEATYANSDYTEQYVVYFQYSDGVWYITDYQKGPYQPS